MDEQQAKAIFVLRVLMAVIALTLGLGLAREDFARVVAERRAVAVGMIAQTLLVPMLGFAVALGFGLDTKLSVGLVLLCACPGGVHSNYYNKLARGDVALSVTLTSVSTLLNMGTLPLWVLLGTHVFAGRGEAVTMSPSDAVGELLALILLPLVLGMALRARLPSLAGKLERGMMWVTGILLVLLVAGSVARQSGLVVQHVQRVGLPVLALQVLAIGTSYVFARAAALPERQRVTVALEGGIQNATLAYALAMALTNDLVVAIPSIVYSIAIYFTAAFFIPFGRRRIPIAEA